MREPFPAVISALESTTIPVTSVDAPSSWDIEQGPPKSGPGARFHPSTLVSLTAPKPLVNFFRGRHFLGGRYVALDDWAVKLLGKKLTNARFVPPSVAEKYDLGYPDYSGLDQVVELPVCDQESKAEKILKLAERQDI